MTVTTIGLDLAKRVFQAHGIDADGTVVLTKRLHRKQMIPFFSKLPPCLIGVEACATAHHWGRALIAPDCHRPRGQDNAAVLCEELRQARQE